MLNKIVGIIVIAAAFVIALLTLNDGNLSILSKPAPCQQLTPAEQLVRLIDLDFTELEKMQQLPPEWKSIEKVEYKIRSSLASALLGNLRPHFARNPKGQVSMEVEVLDLPDDENPGIILQISLFERKGNNKIYEIGRTYHMSSLNNERF